MGWSILDKPQGSEFNGATGELFLNNFWNCEPRTTPTVLTVKLTDCSGNTVSEGTYTIDECEDGCEPIIAWFNGGYNNSIKVNDNSINYVRMKRIDCQVAVFRSDEFEYNPYVLEPNFDCQNSYTGYTNTACVSCSNLSDAITSSCDRVGSCERPTKIEVSNANHVVRFWLNNNANASLSCEYTVFRSFSTSETTTIRTSTEGFIINPNGNGTMITGADTLVRLYIPGAVSCGCNVSGIGKDSFRDNASLEKVTVGCNVQIIGESAFQGCSGIVEIEFPQTSFHIDNYAFKGCSSIEKLSLSNVVSIGEGAFQNCTSLTCVNIGNGNSFTSIGDGAFNGCSNLAIYINATTPPYLGNNAIPQSATIYVPSSSVSTYQTVWDAVRTQIQPMPQPPLPC